VVMCGDVRFSGTPDYDCIIAQQQNYINIDSHSTIAVKLSKTAQSVAHIQLQL